MLKKVAAALLAASMLSAPLLIAGSTAAPAATTQATAAHSAKAVKSVKKHRKHVRHRVRHVKVTRHGKAAMAKVHTARHHVKAANATKRPAKQGAKLGKPGAA